MLRLLILAALTLSLLSRPMHAQAIFTGIQGGIAHYQGDLLNDFSAIRLAKPSGGAFVQFYPWKFFSLQAGINVAKIAGADRYNIEKDLVARNLSFQSGIFEAYGLLQIDIIHYERFPFVPYIFGGIAYFRYNPYTYDQQGEKVFLQPLRTEGQGSTAYPEHKPYKLNNYSYPLGAGVKFHFKQHFFVGLEAGLRKTNTDYLDDVSRSYIDPGILLEHSGPKAVELAFRGDELDPGAPYPVAGTRGDPDQNDWYYITQLKIGINPSFFFTGKQKNFRYNKNKIKKGKVKCPKFD